MTSPDSLSEMIKAIQKFCEERDWDQFHPPKDLAIGMSTESNELLDLFRFKSEAQIQEKMQSAEFKEKVSDELADVFFFVLRFAQLNQIDLTTAMQRKLQKNAAKYPVETAKGSNKKYNE
ncbi:nucleotide pyrophosphohydrolase [Bdellovibrio sp. HCB274]|uniref:nucleotide pyrophosphohydrolase n=1 Tax=Bdellovibrio sp. HCB274 TaxID=3394361 RepID=UPI0039B449D5